jgi:hypothetical protein
MVGGDCPRGTFWPRCSSCPSRVLEYFVSIQLASGFWWEGVWRTVRPDITDCPRGMSCSRTVRGSGTNRPRVDVPVGSFCLCLMDSPPWVADRPRGDRGQSARWPRTVRLGCCRTAKSFPSCFVLPHWDRLGFVPRVGTSVVTMWP